MQQFNKTDRWCSCDKPHILKMTALKHRWLVLLNACCLDSSLFASLPCHLHSHLRWEGLRSEERRRRKESSWNWEMRRGLTVTWPLWPLTLTWAPAAPRTWRRHAEGDTTSHTGSTAQSSIPEHAGGRGRSPAPSCSSSAAAFFLTAQQNHWTRTVSRTRTVQNQQTPSCITSNIRQQITSDNQSHSHSPFHMRSCFRKKPPYFLISFCSIPFPPAVSH